ncbi:hypothetical protein C3Y89_14135 [Rhizobium sp. UPM1132]|nr:hypothetical protein [Rhizobium ruizarguesonis]NKQ77937.1 hypothetical protein [Rhizobium ruizarguesonis]
MILGATDGVNFRGRPSIDSDELRVSAGAHLVDPEIGRPYLVGAAFEANANRAGTATRKERQGEGAQSWAVAPIGEICTIMS